MAEGVLDVNDIKCSMMALTVSDQPNTPQVSSSSSHDQVADIELDIVHDLACGDVDLDCIVNTDLGVGIANGSAIVCNTVWDALLAESYTFHFAQLIL